MKTKKLIVLLIAFLSIAWEHSAAQGFKDSTKLIDIFDMDMEQLMELKTNISSKREQTLAEAPSVVSVITADQIRNMGARDISDVLVTVPGFEFSHDRSGLTYYGVRGYKSLRPSSKILVLMDGTPLNSVFQGTAIKMDHELDMDAIDRIEIIRGPGSALYGRNAFSAVINIITKTGKTGQGIWAKAIGGMMKTLDGGASFGFSNRRTNAYFSVRKVKTNNTDARFSDGLGGEALYHIDADATSLAGNVEIGNLKFNAYFLDLMHGFSHVSQFITDSRGGRSLGVYSMQYTLKLSASSSLRMKLYGKNEKYFENLDYGSSLQLAALEINAPNGKYVNPINFAYNYGAELEGDIAISDNNQLMVGLQTEWYGLTTGLYSNFNLSSGVFYPGVSRSNLVRWPNYIADDKKDYNNMAIYFQDSWKPIDRISLVIGGRLDKDNQSTLYVFSPRLGVVWNAVKDLNLKLLYGQAYRAPSTQEQYATQGAVTGNPNVNPEYIKTIEFSTEYRLGSCNTRLTLFNNVITDLIYSEPNINGQKGQAFYNRGSNNSMGMELEGQAKLGSWLYATGSYTFTRSRDAYKDVTTAHVNVSPHKFNLGAYFNLMKVLTFYTNVNYFSQQEKFASNPVETIGNVALVNASLRLKVLPQLELSLSAYNLFDKVYYYQDNVNKLQPKQPGLQLIGGLSLKL